RRTFLALPLAAAAQAADKPLDLGGVVEKHVMVPMRDGVRLSTWLYLPPGEGPWPVIYEQRYAPIRADRTRLESADFARKGYVVATQSFRGAQDSEGTFLAYRALGLGEQKDGADTIAWFLEQPWSNGKVGSYGASQGGYAQNFLAASRPKALDAQYMVDFGASLFHHGYRQGGAARPMRFRGMCDTAGAAADGEKMLAQQLDHQAYDRWWDVENTMLHFDAMSAPSFLIGSWFDRVNLGVVATWEGRHKAHPGKQQLILGPWVHGRYNKDTLEVGELTFPEQSKFSVIDHQIRWFDHFLKSEQNGIAADAPVRYYVMGACGEPGAPGHQWRESKVWPVPARPTPYYLHEKGGLGLKTPKGAAKTEWSSDPNDPPELKGNQPQSGLDQRKFESHAGVRTFTSEPLQAPVEWTGLVKAKLYVSSDAPDTDILVRLTDVYPDGRSILLSDMVRRMRFRNGFEKQEFLEPGEVYPVEIDITWLSHVFNKGHRIRVTVCSGGAPYWEVNPQTGEAITADLPKTMRTARNAVWHSGKHRSAIIAPIPG
ncbi:MAG: CocE/NonD family hydrolase, partial [Acidobacteria bacterium]|nr:CocE/NonD family hydrolase [Acidobacteriota bacterium]